MSPTGDKDKKKKRKVGDIFFFWCQFIQQLHKEKLSRQAQREVQSLDMDTPNEAYGFHPFDFPALYSGAPIRLF